MQAKKRRARAFKPICQICQVSTLNSALKGCEDGQQMEAGCFQNVSKPEPPADSEILSKRRNSELAGGSAPGYMVHVSGTWI